MYSEPSQISNKELFVKTSSIFNWVLNTPVYFDMYRRSPSQMFFKICVLNYFAISSVLESFFDKVVGLQSYSLIKKRLQHKCFPVNIAKFLRIAIFMEDLWWLIKCRVITLKQVQVASAAFLRCSLRKIFLNSWSIGRRISIAESDLSKFAPATLLSSLSVMENFPEILQEFKENSFQYKK